MITLALNAERLERDNLDSLLAPIRFELDGTPFPDGDWIDFAVVVVGEWLAEVDKFVSAARLTAELHFMDGPYLVRLVRAVGDARPRYKAIQVAVGGEIECCSGCVDAVELLESLWAGGRRLLAMCTARGIKTADSINLKDALETARPVNRTA